MTLARKWRRATLILPAFLLVLGIGAACGGDDDDQGPDNGGSTATEPADASPTIPEGAAVIDQKSLKFSPNKVTVKVGDTVYFKNSETAVHNVALDGEDITGTMRRGAVASYKFETAGEYKLSCQFHPQMKATVVVGS